MLVKTLLIALLNLTDSRRAASSRFFCRAIPIPMTEIKAENGTMSEYLSSSVTLSLIHI